METLKAKVKRQKKEKEMYEAKIQEKELAKQAVAAAAAAAEEEKANKKREQEAKKAEQDAEKAEKARKKKEEQEAQKMEQEESAAKRIRLGEGLVAKGAEAAVLTAPVAAIGAGCHASAASTSSKTGGTMIDGMLSAAASSRIRRRSASGSCVTSRPCATRASKR